MDAEDFDLFKETMGEKFALFMLGAESHSELPTVPDLPADDVLPSVKLESIGTTAIKSIKATKPEYVFPINQKILDEIQEKIKKFNNDGVLKIIEKHSYEINESSGEKNAYKDVRYALTVFGIALNLIGKCPPKYRSMRVPPALIHGTYSQDNSNLSNDRQVIDMHWIYCKQMSVNSVDGYRDLFDPTQPFNWALASNLASKGGSTQRKSKLLGLCEFDEIQLASIVSSETRTRWKTVQENIEKNQRKIRDYTRDNKSRLPINIKTNLIYIYESLLIARSSPALACEVLRFKNSIEISDKQMNRYMRTLKNLKVSL